MQSCRDMMRLLVLLYIMSLAHSVCCLLLSAFKNYIFLLTISNGLIADGISMRRIASYLCNLPVIRKLDGN